MQLRSKIILAIIITQGFVSCFKKEEIRKLDIPDFEQGWGVPLINSTIKLGDLVNVLDSSLGVKEQGDKSYSFFYRDTIESPTVEELLILPDQNFESDLVFPVAVQDLAFPEGINTVNGVAVDNEIFDPGNGGRFRLIDIKGGNLKITARNTFAHHVKMTVSFLSVADKQNNILTASLDMAPLSLREINLPLQNYAVNLSATSNEFNNFKYKVEYSITSSGKPVTNQDKISMDIKLQNLKYSFIYGDIGSIDFPPYNGKLNIEAFEQASLGNIFFSHARLNLDYESSLGIPVTFTINKLKSFTHYGKEVDITPASPKFTIALLTPPLSEKGSFKRTPIQLDSSNSSITDAINPSPNLLEYDFSTSLASNMNNFILDVSRIKVYAQIEIPLKGYVSNYEVKDTMVIEKLPQRTFDGDASVSIDSAIFKLKLENRLPLNAYSQLYFLDSDYNKIDSLLIQPGDLLESNNISPTSGEVMAATTKISTISMSGGRYDKITTNAKYFYIHLRFKTPVINGKQANIVLQSDNSLKLVVSVLTKGKIKLN